MNIRLFAVVAASILSIGTADAQTYYAREILKGVGQTSQPATPPAPPRGSVSCSALAWGYMQPLQNSQSHIVRNGINTEAGALQFCQSQTSTFRAVGCEWHSKSSTVYFQQADIMEFRSHPQSEGFKAVLCTVS